MRGKLPIFIFDIGGVTIIWRNNDPIFKALAIQYGVSFRKMKSIMAPALSDLESGKISTRAYLEKCLRKTGKRIKPNENAMKLLADPFDKGAKSRKGVIEIIKGLKKHGHRVYAFSNTSPPHVPIMRKKGWTTPLFDGFFASYLIKDSKPSTSAYRKVLARIGASPRDVVFIDNTERNVDGAKRAGIKNSIRFHSVESLGKNIRIILRDYAIRNR